ncbi:allergen Asp f 7 homolog [Penaeus chinensis]|uniref:allergen Asp f 7 homolog n=1 Tax=Penaeus chinensis TaxID=139456 RepID=UPI001FB72862|nr:allergen Asp f 7 homolog [Penaeus chinensis]
MHALPSAFVCGPKETSRSTLRFELHICHPTPQDINLGPTTGLPAITYLTLVPLCDLRPALPQLPDTTRHQLSYSPLTQLSHPPPPPLRLLLNLPNPEYSSHPPPPLTQFAPPHLTQLSHPPLTQLPPLPNA